MVTLDRARSAAAGALLLAGLLACHSSTSAWGQAPAKPSRAGAGGSGGGGAHSPAAFDAGPALRVPRGDLATECSQRRIALARALGGPAVVWLGAPKEDELHRFFQSDDFYYLSGVEIPGIGLALKVGPGGTLEDEVLFLPPHDRNFEVWNGKRLTSGPEAARETGFRRTAALAEQLGVLETWGATSVHVIGEPPAAPPKGVTTTDGAPVREALDALRLAKSDYEIDCLANAIDITCRAIHAASAGIEPGNYEYQPQGLLEGSFLFQGAERPGFTSILGSGPNSVTLHYDKNRRQMQDGELLVMDVGAKWRYYTADVTRTFPVNGRFTPRQREVYQIVLDAQTAAFEAAKPGVTMRELDAIARKVIVDRGFGPERKYFKHSLGHWIGLYVHDVGDYGPILPGMLFTIEPGIYITEENLGVRIEDDYLMTESGAVKLSTGFPSDPDAIEALMARS